MKKFGFTLAEVLLAVAILGVVAAVTIGVLRNVIPEDYTYTAKKASVTLSEGVKTMLEDDKKYPGKEFKNGEKFCKDYAGLFKMGVNVDCNQNEPVENIENAAVNGLSKDSDLYNKANIKASNGEVWWGVSQNFEGDEPIKILTDVNGPNKGNNKLGEDIVALDLYKNGKIGVHEVANTSRTPDKDGALGICSPITTVISRENISDKAENEKANVAHRLCYQEIIRCTKDGETTETTRPEVCIECPDVEDRKVLINDSTGIITRDYISNMANTSKAGIEYRRECPASLNAAINNEDNENELKYEDGSSVGKITLNEALNTLETHKVGEKEKHAVNYYGKAHITKVDNCTIRQRAVLVNQLVYEKGVEMSEEIAAWTTEELDPLTEKELMGTEDMLLWNDKNSKNTISGSLRIGVGNDCGTIDSAIYKKDGRGASVRMVDPTSLKLFEGNSGNNKDYINLGCGYLTQCTQIERDCGGTAFYKYKEFDMPFVFGSRNDGVTKCERCDFPTRNILKITMTDPNNAAYACRTEDKYGDCPNGENEWTYTKYKKQCTQARRECPPLTAGGKSYNFSSNFPGGSMGGDGNMNLVDDDEDPNKRKYDRDGGIKGCKPCDLFNSYFLKTDKNQQTATSVNSTELNKHTFKYMTACTQVRRECEDTTFNYGFDSNKFKNLLGCSACYSENKIKNRTSDARCQVRRYCSQADQNRTGYTDNAYSRYKGFDTGNVEYSCACEQLSTNVPRLPYKFKYCRNLIGNTCPSSKSNRTTTTKDYTIKIPSSHVNKEVYNLRRVKDNSNNYRNEDQIVEYEPYNPVAGNLSTKEGKLSPYFLPEKCETNNGFKCEVTGYNYSAQTFTIRVHMQTKCTRTCSGNDWQTYAACKTCARYKTYSCGSKKNPKTCKKCVKWKSNGRCMRKEAVNDTLSKVTLYYTYADPLCSRKFTPIPIPCTSCVCMQTGSSDTCTECGTCTFKNVECDDKNPPRILKVCTNASCNETFDNGKPCPTVTHTKTYTIKTPIIIGDDPYVRPDLGSPSQYVKNCVNLRSSTSTANKNKCVGTKYISFSDIKNLPKDAVIESCKDSSINDRNCTKIGGGAGRGKNIYCLSKSTASCEVLKSRKKLKITISAGAYVDGNRPQNKINAFDDWAIKRITLTVTYKDK